MASPAFEPVLGNMSAVFVIGTAFGELKTVFDKLAVGADRERFQALHEMPFGVYGQFYDEYSLFKRAVGYTPTVEPGLAVTHKADYVDRVCFPFGGCFGRPREAAICRAGRR